VTMKGEAMSKSAPHRRGEDWLRDLMAALAALPDENVSVVSLATHRYLILGRTTGLGIALDPDTISMVSEAVLPSIAEVVQALELLRWHGPDGKMRK